MKKFMLMFSAILLLTANSVHAAEQLKELEKQIEELQTENKKLEGIVRLLESMRFRKGRGWGTEYKVNIPIRCNDAPVLKSLIENENYELVGQSLLRRDVRIIGIENLYVNAKEKKLRLVMWYPNNTGCILYTTEPKFMFLDGDFYEKKVLTP